MSAIANSKLFSALQTGKNKNGPVKLGHRIVLAPLTRNRGTEPNLCPHQDHVDYYSQRATAGGLLITEAVNISPEAVGYISVPGIISKNPYNQGSLISLQNTEGLGLQEEPKTCDSVTPLNLDQ